jgi:aminomethyltransferase
MKKTKFFSIHENLGAKIVEFAGYLMPIQYTSIIAEHKAVRKSVGVFDVSHMGEIFVTGEKALDFVQHITVNDASVLFPGRVQYSAMCYPDGGIVDDLLVYRIAEDKFMLVVNASNIEKDFNWMRENNKFGVELNNMSDDYSLLAIQGPKSKEVIQKICDKSLDLEYYHFFNAKIAGIDVLISRTGYTGELGYELYFSGEVQTAKNIWEAVFGAGKEFDIEPIGLAARDSLRLEMGFCLYGNDIDQTTNPLEAGLGWITKLKKQSFVAKDVLLKAKSEGLKRKLVPIITEEKVFPRKGYDVTVGGRKIGTLTSGTVSPVLDKAIAMGFVETKFSEEGSVLNILIRGREVPAKVTRLPFVKT